MGGHAEKGLQNQEHDTVTYCPPHKVRWNSLPRGGLGGARCGEQAQIELKTENYFNVERSNTSITLPLFAGVGGKLFFPRTRSRLPGVTKVRRLCRKCVRKRWSGKEQKTNIYPVRTSVSFLSQDWSYTASLQRWPAAVKQKTKVLSVKRCRGVGQVYLISKANFIIRKWEASACSVQIAIILWLGSLLTSSSSKCWKLWEVKTFSNGCTSCQAIPYHLIRWHHLGSRVELSLWEADEVSYHFCYMSAILNLWFNK